jgi:hypothetical protein
MQRPIHTIQCREVDELPRRLVCVDVWLTELDFAENAQLRKLSSTPLNTLEVDASSGLESAYFTVTVVGKTIDGVPLREELFVSKSG